MQDLDTIIGSKIRIARGLAGLTQTDLGSILGVSYQQIQKYETGGSRVAASTLKVISNHTHKPLDWFFDETEKGLLENYKLLMKMSRAFLSVKDKDIQEILISLSSAIGGRDE